MHAILEDVLRPTFSGAESLLAAARALAPEPLFPAQRQALDQSGILEGKSALIHMPTGSGKTLVGAAAVLACLRDRKIAVVLVPFRALAREHAALLSASLGPAGYRVVASSRDDRAADADIIGGRVDVVVCVYEKFIALLLQSPGLLKAVSVVVADEFHLVEDSDRGARAELLLRAIRRMSPALPIVGLTSQVVRCATLVGDLGLRRFESGERPVALRQGVFDLSTGRGEWTCVSSGECGEVSLDEEAPTPLLGLIAASEKPMLVFVATKRSATQLCAELSHAASPGPSRAVSGRVGGMLDEWLARGVAFHTTDLTRQQRHAVEDALRSGMVDICVSTGTLAEGVNFGVRTVIVVEGFRNLTEREASGMFGRAGRPGSGVGTAWLARQHVVSSDKIEILAERRCEPLGLLAMAISISPSMACGELIKWLEEAGLMSGSAVEAWQQGQVRGLWREVAGNVELLPAGRALATGGVEVDVVVGWRTMTRRFTHTTSDAAVLLLALGGGQEGESIILTASERQSGRWVAELTTLLGVSDDALATYFSDLLRDHDDLPRKLHVAAKATVLYLRLVAGIPPEEIEGDFGVTAGVAEEFLHTARHRMRLLIGLWRSVHPDCPEPSALLDAPAPVLVRDAAVHDATPDDDEDRWQLTVLSSSTGEIRLAGCIITLTRYQFRLLEILARNAGSGVAYERIESHLWGTTAVERQQVGHHRRQLERRIQEAIPGAPELTEVVSSWGLRLRLAKNRVAFEASPVAELRAVGRRHHHAPLAIVI